MHYRRTNGIGQARRPTISTTPCRRIFNVLLTSQYFYAAARVHAALAADVDAMHFGAAGT